jgi:hypothetical protein
VETLPCERAREGFARSEENEQKTPPQPLGGLQGQRGVGGDPRRKMAGLVGQAIRRASESDHGLEEPFLERAANLFGADEAPAEPKSDVKKLHVKIGQQRRAPRGRAQACRDADASHGHPGEVPQAQHEQRHPSIRSTRTCCAG